MSDPNTDTTKSCNKDNGSDLKNGAVLTEAENSQNSRKFPRKIIFIAGLCLVGIISAIVIVNSATPSPLSKPSVTPRESSDATSYSTFIKLLDNTLSPEPYVKVLEEEFFHDCQPEFFDPKTAKYHKEKNEGFHSGYYVLDNQVGSEVFMIDGREKEGEAKVILPPPYEVITYRFSCASTSSFVLDISKENKRLFLFTHVSDFKFSPTEKLLFINDMTKDTSGGWEKRSRIIDLETNGKIELPNVDCTSESGFWDKENLITYGGAEDCPEVSKICLWGKDGRLLKRLKARLDQFAGGVCYTTSELGLLPKNSSIFYATVHGDSENSFSGCRLVLQDINEQETNKSFIIDNSKDPNHCPNPIEFDFQNFNFSDNVLRYKYLENYGGIWTSWLETSVEIKNKD